jgi:hypothetical protein
MDIDRHVDALQQQFLNAGRARGDQARGLIEELNHALASAIRLTLLETLSNAADEITRELAPGSVEVRLRGLDPSFAVTTPPSEAVAPPGATETPPAQEDGPVARINFRPPEGLKNRIDDAAAREGLSVNAWLIRVVGAALTTDQPGSTGERHHLGWVR